MTASAPGAAPAPEWTVKLLSTEDLAYPWNYGTRALIAERERVEQILTLRSDFDGARGLSGLPHEEFKVPLSFEEAFVGSDAQRIAIMDRVRTYYNFNWKRDALAKEQQYQGQQDFLLHQHYAANRHFEKLMSNLLLMQALTEELKPETHDLVRRCTSSEQLLKCMLNASQEASALQLHR